jgi:hypothetical protein
MKDEEGVFQCLKSGLRCLEEVLFNRIFPESSYISLQDFLHLILEDLIVSDHKQGS